MRGAGAPPRGRLPSSQAGRRVKTGREENQAAAAAAAEAEAAQAEQLQAAVAATCALLAGASAPRERAWEGGRDRSVEVGRKGRRERQQDGASERGCSLGRGKRGAAAAWRSCGEWRGSRVHERDQGLRAGLEAPESGGRVRSGPGCEGRGFCEGKLYLRGSWRVMSYPPWTDVWRGRKNSWVTAVERKKLPLCELSIKAQLTGGKNRRTGR